ncbi:putative osmotically inducible sensory protein [Novosphingobium sp. Rr 2-17]|uniref:BON domain-containing protein n=1 Tax=Novosphingobium sp. Rr 2-17 TaxID=555793 RepID=UPI000269A1CA|nr:BON domain-containing protein [Novosphingobium sp. Rr 2-17]EIZ79714.1 putative osmotically inducible sensory protein [Novosphingobium sp. Rr 2-17]
MTRRDQNPNNQQSGGYRNDDAWDSPRQASQWSEGNRQAGGNWDDDDNSQRTYRNNREAEGRYGQGRQDDRHRDDWQDRDYEGVSPGARAQGLRDDDDDYRPYNGPQSRGGYGSDRSGSNDRGGEYRESQYGRNLDSRNLDLGRYRGEYSRGAYGRNDSGRQDQRYGARSGPAHLPHSYDASYGQDFSSFTGDDYGGRDFSGSRGGLTGGARSSESYRPSYGIGSGSRSNSRNGYGDWRQYGESRGFFEKAGDEIASWFGDEDATRRREDDHRGRGPSDYKRSDERVREDINDKLTHDWRVDASHVRVTVKDGEVSLEGSVASREAKRRAEDVADEVSGVRHVQNNLRVGSPSQTGGTSTLATGGTNASSTTAASAATSSPGSYSSSTGTGANTASSDATTGTRSTDKSS